jgi:aminoglycoside 6'-N-acetyltransferase
VSHIGLRALQTEDADELSRIHREPEVARWWGHPDPGFPFEDFPEADRFVVDRDGVVLGMVEVCEENEPRYRHASIDIFLDPVCHGQGVGTEAVRMVLAWLVKRGHHRVTIDPALANVAAIRSYEKAGFKPVGVMHRYEREPFGPAWHDGLLMEYLARPQGP